MKTSFLSQLRQDFPEYVFKTGKKFAFRFPKTIIFGPSEAQEELLALHELSHAILKHKDFKLDVERLKMENQIEVDEDFIQEQLDTYRDWLHKKSRCPICELTRFQTPDGEYHCPRCENFT